MKASNISESLELLITNKQPAFLWGAPGVGKSQVVQQTATRMNLQLIDVRAILLDPVDLRGIPKINEQGMSEWCAPSFLPTSGQGVLFLDELNAAPPLVQAACYQLILDRRIGEYQLPDGWAIIAAGNRETDRAITHRMPSALSNRFVHIDFTVDHDEWLSWGQKNNIAGDILSFIQFRPNLLHDFNPDKNERAFPSPRSWQFASQVITSAPPQDLLSELLEGTIGKAATTELLAFLKIFNHLPDINEIINTPLQAQVPSDPAILYATCEMIGKSVQPETAENIITFANRLPDEFSVLLLREAVRNCKEICNLNSFSSWASTHAEILV